jgi:hypothetical protein
VDVWCLWKGVPILRAQKIDGESKRDEDVIELRCKMVAERDPQKMLQLADQLAKLLFAT